MDSLTVAGAPPSIAERCLESAGEALARGIPLPEDMLSSLTLFVPKGEFQKEDETVVRQVLALRPTMNSSSKLIALVAGEPPGAMADRVVHPAQRGFIASREMGGDIIEVEGSLVACSMALESPAVAILLDFTQAFPSIARRWMWMVLDRLGACVELQRRTTGTCTRRCSTRDAT